MPTRSRGFVARPDLMLLLPMGAFSVGSGVLLIQEMMTAAEVSARWL